MTTRPHDLFNSAYAQAGVDIELGNQVKATIQDIVKRTHGPAVLGKVGGFGGLFSGLFPGMEEPVLVSSIDGVGTKLKLAFATGRHERAGQDIVNHCVNDIVATGARPLFFLDYVGTGKLAPSVFNELLVGMAAACEAAGCALIGGETAQMPGMYQDSHYDLVGCIVGIVDRKHLLDGKATRPGDILLGLPSSGLHTNGYALAQKILLETLALPLDQPPPGHGDDQRTLGDLLTTVHRSYLDELNLIPRGHIKAIAHITGGGLIDNIPRTLPRDCDAHVRLGSWVPSPLFRLIQDAGDVDTLEMHRTFNMGIGLTITADPAHAAEIQKILPEAIAIGHITEGAGEVLLDD